MESGLDDVAFLALSENRIALLGALRDEHTHHRDELMELSEVSRATLARVLNDLESRAWISQYGQTCQITPLGSWVYDEFTDFLKMMDAAVQLRNVMRWIPASVLDQNVIRQLDDAEIVFATESEPMAPIRRATEEIQGRTHLDFLTTQVTVSYFAVIRDSVSDTDLTVRGIITPDVCQTLANNTTLTSLYQELTQSDTVEFFVVEDSLPIVQIMDDIVGIGLINKAKQPQGLILSTNQAVCAWAETAFDSYYENSTRLTSDKMAQIQEQSRPQTRPPSLP